MSIRTKIFLFLLFLFIWVVHQSDSFERIETRNPSDVPGVPEKVTVEYRMNWGKLNGYVRSFIPR